MEKVSVIIPIYNASKYLERCLDNLLSSKINLEIILINDGSSDNSLDICKKYQKDNKCIKIIDQKNSGQGVARNKGIDNATGKYLMFVDSDDFIDSKVLDIIFNLAESHDYDLIYTDYYEYDGVNKKIVRNNKSKDQKKNAVLANPAPWGKLFKTSLLKNNNIKFLEGRIFEDIVIIPTIASLADNPFYFSDSFYYYNMESDSSIRRKKYNKKLEDIFISIDETYKSLENCGAIDKYYDEIEYLFFDSFLKGGVLRFADFKEGIPHIKEVRKKVLNYFPNAKHNKYYKKENFKMKLIYNLSISCPPKLLYLIKGIF